MLSAQSYKTAAFLFALALCIFGCVPKEHDRASEERLRSEIESFSARCKTGDQQACKDLSRAKVALYEIVGCHCSGTRPKGHPAVR